MAEKSKGLGDTVAKVLKKVGVRKQKICNCTKRQRLLNKYFPYGRSK